LKLKTGRLLGYGGPGRERNGVLWREKKDCRVMAARAKSKTWSCMGLRNLLLNFPTDDKKGGGAERRISQEWLIKKGMGPRLSWGQQH